MKGIYVFILAFLILVVGFFLILKNSKTDRETTGVHDDANNQYVLKKNPVEVCKKLIHIADEDPELLVYELGEFLMAADIFDNANPRNQYEIIIPKDYNVDYYRYIRGLKIASHRLSAKLSLGETQSGGEQGIIVEITTIKSLLSKLVVLFQMNTGGNTGMGRNGANGVMRKAPGREMTHGGMGGMKMGSGRDLLHWVLTCGF